LSSDLDPKIQKSGCVQKSFGSGILLKIRTKVNICKRTNFQ
jgi:hypothetical protein